MPVVSLSRIRSARINECGRVVLAIGVIAMLLASCEEPTEGPADELEARLDVGDPQRFGFLYRAGGTGVLDCALRNRQFHVTVDAASGAVEVRRESASGSPLAVSLPNAVLVHRSAFDGSSIATEWISVLESGAPTPAVVSEALGVDAASYVLSPGMPEDGAGMVASLIDSATSVTELATPPDDLIGADGYRIELPAEVEPSIPDAREAVVDAWLDRNDIVRRVRVFEPGSEAAGWTLDFTDPAPAMDISPEAVTAIDDLPPLRPALIRGCRLG